MREKEREERERKRMVNTCIHTSIHTCICTKINNICVSINGLVYTHISLLCHLKEHISSNSPVTMNTPSFQILGFKYHSLRELGLLGEVVNFRAGAEKIYNRPFTTLQSSLHLF